MCKVAIQVWHGMARLGAAQHGPARHGQAVRGPARHGVARVV